MLSTVQGFQAWGRLIWCVAIVVLVAASARPAPCAVNRILARVSVPADVLAVDAALDAAGTLHVVFARQAGCAYAARPVGQSTFEAELAIPGTDVRVQSSPGSQAQKAGGC